MKTGKRAVSFRGIVTRDQTLCAALVKRNVSYVHLQGFILKHCVRLVRFGLQGVARFYEAKKKHIVTTQTVRRLRFSIILIYHLARELALS